MSVQKFLELVARLARILSKGLTYVEVAAEAIAGVQRAAERLQEPPKNKD